MASFKWPSNVATPTGVTALNGLTGSLTLVAGANITITPAGSNITIASTAVSAPVYTSGQVVFGNGVAGGTTSANLLWDNSTNVLSAFEIHTLNGTGANDGGPITSGNGATGSGFGTNGGPIQAGNAGSQNGNGGYVGGGDGLNAGHGGNMFGGNGGTSGNGGNMFAGDAGPTGSHGGYVASGYNGTFTRLYFGAFGSLKNSSFSYDVADLDTFVLKNATITVFDWSTKTNAINSILPTQTGNSGKFLTTDGTNTSWANTTDTGVTTIGTIDSQAKAANGLVISGVNLYAQTADATNPGMVSTAVQTFAGDKSFTGTILAAAGTAALPGLAFSAEPSSGLFRFGVGQINLSILGATVLNVGTSGLAVTGLVSATSTVTGTQLISTIATGTAPLVVASTTQVANLNAATSGIATNITGGAGGSIPYQTAASTTTMLANGTAGNFLKSAGGTSAPTWSAFTAPTYQRFNTTGTTAGYQFNVTAANATVGATYTNNGNTYTVLSTIAGSTVLFCSNAAAPQASGTLTKATGTGDATITFSVNFPIAQYTLPAGALYIRVRGVAGGGGGAGGGVGNGGAGGAGTRTSFAFTMRSSAGNGGTGGGATGGAGGTVTEANLDAVGSGAAWGGGDGTCGNDQSTTLSTCGGMGGSTLFGGGGRGGIVAAGVLGKANTGAGGGGGGLTGGVGGQNGGGGGAGAAFDYLVYSPASTYYQVGTGGTAGGAGTSGFAGGAGADGRLEIWEYYQ